MFALGTGQAAFSQLVTTPNGVRKEPAAAITEVAAAREHRAGEHSD